MTVADRISETVNAIEICSRSISIRTVGVNNGRTVTGCTTQTVSDRIPIDISGGRQVVAVCSIFVGDNTDVRSRRRIVYRIDSQTESVVVECAQRVSDSESKAISTVVV